MIAELMPLGNRRLWLVVPFCFAFNLAASTVSTTANCSSDSGNYPGASSCTSADGSLYGSGSASGGYAFVGNSMINASATSSAMIRPIGNPNGFVSVGATETIEIDLVTAGAMRPGGTLSFTVATSCDSDETAGATASFSIIQGSSTVGGAACQSQSIFSPGGTYQFPIELGEAFSVIIMATSGVFASSIVTPGGGGGLISITNLEVIDPMGICDPRLGCSAYPTVLYETPEPSTWWMMIGMIVLVTHCIMTERFTPKVLYAPTTMRGMLNTSKEQSPRPENPSRAMEKSS